MKGKLIKITSGGANGSTRIGINGRNRRLMHNREIAVSENELEVLQGSNVKFEVVGDAKAAQLENAVDAGDGNRDGNTDPTTRTEAGADNLNKPAPVTSAPVRLTPKADDTPAGADHLTKTTGIGGEQTEEARQAAVDAAQAAEDGTTEPAVVLTNDDPNQTGELNREPFNPETTLDQSIAKITEDMDEFTTEQLEALLKAEKSGKNRSSLITAIEKKLA